MARWGNLIIPWLPVLPAFSPSVPPGPVRSLHYLLGDQRLQGTPNKARRILSIAWHLGEIGVCLALLRALKIQGKWSLPSSSVQSFGEASTSHIITHINTQEQPFVSGGLNPGPRTC